MEQERKESNSAAVVIELEDVGKRYILRKQKTFLVHEALKKLVGKRRSGDEFWALRDASTRIYRGDTLGVIGSNGAGKSTLLGLIAGTVFPTLGSVRIHGRVGALLELGAGFHADLTGRENVYLNASLLGLQRDEVEATFDHIVEFSELREFIDFPLRTYSSGMQVRLGFSVAVHIDPEILIMDEVLAVGDTSFQHKCIAKINQFREEKKTMILVSHSPEAVRSLCSRVIWLDQGKIRMDGPSGDVVAAYLASVGD